MGSRDAVTEYQLWTRYRHATGQLNFWYHNPASGRNLHVSGMCRTDGVYVAFVIQGNKQRDKRATRRDFRVVPTGTDLVEWRDLRRIRVTFFYLYPDAISAKEQQLPVMELGGTRPVVPTPRV